MKLKNLYQKFLKFKERKYVKDVQFWFGVEKARPSKKEIEKVIGKYELESFLNFLKYFKEIIYSKNPLELVLKWSTDQWPLYYLLFLL